jgi:hypothetical protein
MTSLAAVNSLSYSQEVFSQDSSTIGARVNNSSLTSKIKIVSAFALTFFVLALAYIPTAQADTNSFTICFLGQEINAVMHHRGFWASFESCYWYCFPWLAI